MPTPIDVSQPQLRPCYRLAVLTNRSLNSGMNRQAQKKLNVKIIEGDAGFTGVHVRASMGIFREYIGKKI